MPASRFYEISALTLAGCLMVNLGTTYLPIFREPFETWPPGAFLASVAVLVTTLVISVTAMQLNFDWFPQPTNSTWADTKASISLTAHLHHIWVLVAAVLVAAFNPAGYKFKTRMPELSWDLGTVVVAAGLLALLIWRTLMLQKKAVIAPEDWGE